MVLRLSTASPGSWYLSAIASTFGGGKLLELLYNWRACA